MDSLNFILSLAIILLSTKLLGILAQRFHMPQVVGALLAGLILGPSCLAIVNKTATIAELSQLGVILLMFSAGLETDLEELKKCGKASFIIALLGLIISLIGGFLIAGIFNNPGKILTGDFHKVLENIFIGIILTATSVSITVETLQEMGKLKTASGTAILGAAIIDDILGIIALTIVTSLADSSVKLSFVLLKIVAFFIIAFFISFVFVSLFKNMWNKKGEARRVPILALGFCLIMAFAAERFFGVADITGAYVAGIIISRTPACEYIEKKIEVVSFLFLSPIFFANIGISTTIDHMNSTMIMFTIALTVIAIVTKIYGCKFGARICGYTKEESLQIGIGMVSRGEVALIITNIGASTNILESKFFAPVILMVIITTLITPALLKLVYSKDVKHKNVLHKAS